MLKVPVKAGHMFARKVITLAMTPTPSTVLEILDGLQAYETT